MIARVAAPMKPGHSRALAVALLIFAIVLGAAVLVAPFVLMHRHYDVAIESMQDRIERYRRVAAQAPELKKTLDAVSAKEGRRFFLKNIAPNLAGAELQDMVKVAVESNQGRITVIQNTAPKEDGRFRQIGVNLQLFATTPNLQKILYSIETQQPYLLIDNLTVRPLNAFRGFKPTPGNEPEVSVMLDVVGFAYAEGEKK